MTQFNQKRPHYSSTFKRKVVRSVLREEYSVLEASAHYGIGGSMTVYRWLSKLGPEIRLELGILAPTMSKDSSSNKSELAAEVESLRRLLELERLRSEAYLTMIKLAEEKYSIPIEKKSGAKRSK